MKPAGKLQAVFPPLGADEVGGVQTSGRIAKSLLESQATFDARVISVGGRNTLLSRKEGTSPDLMAIPETIASIRRFKPDVLLFWHLGHLKLLPFLGAGQSKVVVFLHGIEAWRSHGAGMGRLLARVDRFFTNSAHTWDRFISLNPGLRYHDHTTVHLGLGEPTNRVPSEPLNPMALMLSRLLVSERYKGHSSVIDAWSLVRQREPDANLVIAGEGDLRPELERLVSTNRLEHSISFTGLVSEQQKAGLLEQCTCFLMPSRNEGFGLVYLEAMRIGKACLVGTNDAGPEVINPPEGGLAVDPDSRSELAQSILQLLDHEGWTQRARSTKQRFENNFTESHFKTRMLDALRTSMNQ